MADHHHHDHSHDHDAEEGQGFLRRALKFAWSMVSHDHSHGHHHGNTGWHPPRNSAECAARHAGCGLSFTAASVREADAAAAASGAEHDHSGHHHHHGPTSKPPSPA